MSNALPQFIPPNAAWVDTQTGLLTHVASVWLRQLWERVGGSIAPTNNELSATEYADAGIESMQAEIYQLRDQVDTLQTQIAELTAKVASMSSDDIDAYDTRELLAALTARVEGLDQGVAL